MASGKTACSIASNGVRSRCGAPSHLDRHLNRLLSGSAHDINLGNAAIAMAPLTYDTVADLSSAPNSDIGRLNGLALSAGPAIQDILQLWNTLLGHTGIKSYHLMSRLSREAQPVVLKIITSLGRQHTDFSRLEKGPWQLSFDRLTATFGCPALTSVSFVSHLTTLASNIPATTTWDQVMATLKTVQQQRLRGGVTRKRGTSMYKTWEPADVTTAQAALLAAIPTQPMPSPVTTEPATPPMQSGMGQLPEHVETRKRKWRHNSVPSVEAPRRAPLSPSGRVFPLHSSLPPEPHTPTNKRRVCDKTATFFARGDVSPLSSVYSARSPVISQIALSVDDSGTTMSTELVGDAAKEPLDSFPFPRHEGQEDSDDDPEMETFDDNDTIVSHEPAVTLQRPALELPDEQAADDAAEAPQLPTTKEHNIAIPTVELAKLVGERTSSQLRDPIDEQAAADHLSLTAQRLSKHDESGRLSHVDFTHIFDRVLPSNFRSFDVPNLDGSYDWTAWAKRPVLRSIDMEARYFSVLHLSASQHWILFEIAPASKILTIYDSLNEATNNERAHTAQCVVAHMGFDWDAEGWRHQTAATPTQVDGHSCGIHVLACAMYRVAGEVLPRRIDVRLWRYALSAILTEADAPFDVATHLDRLASVAPLTNDANANLALVGKSWINDHVQSLRSILGRLESSLREQQTALDTAIKSATTDLATLETIVLQHLALSQQTIQDVCLQSAHVPYVRAKEAKRQNMTRYVMDKEKLSGNIKGMSRVVNGIAAMKDEACSLVQENAQKARETIAKTQRMLDTLDTI
ncbi:hypothetical protein ACEQ8H_008516 [Pleosporales sp. CAS-2024a]